MRDENTGLNDATKWLVFRGEHYMHSSLPQWTGYPAN
jgi:hypothetical protein